MTKTKHASNLLSSFALKVIACVLMTMDHVALLFVSPVYQETLYYVLRAIGKISFPIFAFLAFQGAYQTHDIRKYLLRLLVPALLLDAFGYLVGFFADISVAANPLIGNAFTDIFLGVLLTYLLKRRDCYSFLAVLPVLYAFFSTFPISESYGTLFKTDWGFFSIVLFLAFSAGKACLDFLLRYRAQADGVEEEAYRSGTNIFFYEKATSCVALFFTEALFYLIYRLDNSAFVLPNQFVPIGTYSTLAIVFLLLASPKKGYRSRKVQYAFYAYYPLHLALLGLIAIGLGYL